MQRFSKRVFKIYKKLTEAASNYPQWVAAISGTLGQPKDQGFILSEPYIQVFERKPKATTLLAA